jgi:phosphoglycerol transferase MdoB-like AlkP superfamily enzyme
VDEYVRSLEPTNKNAYTGLFKGKNLIFISAEAFTAEVIDPELTPTLYRLATKGINFTDYYQPASAGTTGGEYANLMGMLPTAGGKSMKNTQNNHNYMTIGSLLNDEGYYGKAFHNNNYKYYSRHKTHVNLGYSDGYMGYGNGMEEYVEKTWPESDLEMIQGTLPTYIDQQPFNIYYMSVSGHSDYSVEENAMSKKHWDEVKDLDYSDTVKAYLAAQLELEAALTYLVDELENAGIADDTVICISADHFPYGLDQNETDSYEYLSELYGYEVTNNFERDHNRLILWSGCLEDEEPIVVSSPTFSPDILPTLCNLFGIAYDSRLLPGRDVFSDSEALVYDLSYNWKTDYGTYYASKGKFVPAGDDVEIPDGYVDQIKQIVKNKINYSKKVLNLDYYAHVFSDKE